MRFVCYFFGFLVLLGLIFSFTLYQTLKPKPQIYLETKKIAGPVYEPKPQTYNPRRVEITQEIRERAEYEILY